ncbi:hypothetical protein EMPG_12614 [Blastomyces silverae]|uniref:Hydrophobin n=1 Tax=Blastomyces silverae TaxID=2060906 RepID=A0A0H1BML4_9EURO|nr:hypothetical protein EMPG_12614 [Blastomyces silverae]
MFPSTLSLTALLLLLARWSTATLLPHWIPQPSNIQCPEYYAPLCCQNSFPQMYPKNALWVYMCRDPEGGSCLPTIEEPLCCPPGRLDYCIKFGSPALEV